MRIFKKYDIPITFYAVARAFEKNMAVAEYAEAEGHEVASHCYKVDSLLIWLHRVLTFTVESVYGNVG